MSAPDQRILDVQPTDIHQRVPVIIGSADEVDHVSERICAEAASSDGSGRTRPDRAVGDRAARPSPLVQFAIAAAPLGVSLLPLKSMPCGSHVLTADKVLVTIGTPCSVSAVGTHGDLSRASRGAPEFIAFAAFDAGLDRHRCRSPTAAEVHVGQRRARATLAEIEQRHGATLRAQSRHPLHRRADRCSGSVVTDIAASLPHDFAEGGLRRLAGLTYRDVRESALKDMYGLFDDDPRLGPSLQSQLFIYSGIGALAALPVALSELLPNPLRIPRRCRDRIRRDGRYERVAREPAPSRWTTTSCATSSRCGWRIRCRRTDRR